MTTTPSSNFDEILNFTLNAAAIADIRAAAGGFFSIGGSLDMPGKTGSFTLFSGSGAGGIQRLVLDVRPVPEPSSLALAGIGFVVLTLRSLQRKAAV